MLLFSLDIGKTKIDEFDVIVSDHLQDFINCGHLGLLKFRQH